jgi:hypothetical protein
MHVHAGSQNFQANSQGRQLSGRELLKLFWLKQLLFGLSLSKAMFIDVACSDLQQQAAEAEREAAQKKRRLAYLQKAEQKRWKRCLRWLRVLWVLGGGNSSLMRSAWVIEEAKQQCVWDHCEIVAFDINFYVSEDIESQRLTEEERHFLYEPNTKDELELWYSAWVFFAEWQLTYAVMTLNLHKKLVAPADFIHVEFQKIMTAEHPSVPPAVIDMARNALATRSSDEAKRQWLLRWRRRWGFKHSKLPARDLMFPDQFQRKVFLACETPSGDQN